MSSTKASRYFIHEHTAYNYTSSSKAGQYQPRHSWSPGSFAAASILVFLKYICAQSQFCGALLLHQYLIPYQTIPIHSCSASLLVDKAPADGTKLLRLYLCGEYTWPTGIGTMVSSGNCLLQAMTVRNIRSTEVTIPILLFFLRKSNSTSPIARRIVLREFVSVMAFFLNFRFWSSTSYKFSLCFTVCR